MSRFSCAGRLREELWHRRRSGGGWSYLGHAQTSIEATCLASLALADDSVRCHTPGDIPLLTWQNRDGSWPAFVGDTEGSWTTALALVTVARMYGQSNATERAGRWLMGIRGLEAHWLWRWKFKTADVQARIDPDKFGWPWIPSANSWVIPTAFAVVALKQFITSNLSGTAEQRIKTGVAMLLDRACMGGGWNAGNSVVYSFPLAPHVEPTAVALLALQDEPPSNVVWQSLDWLTRRAGDLQAVSSLAWATLAMSVYQKGIDEQKKKLAGLVGNGTGIRNNATLAVALMALQRGERPHPFAVLR